MTTTVARILIVEDEFVIAELIKDMLEAMGYEHIVHVASLSDALTVTDIGEWRGAFLDIRINGTLVFPLADRLNALGVPFAFCSGDGEAASIPSAFSHVPILPKPWAAGELERLAAHVLKD